MTIAFNQVPANSRVPFMFVEFDSSRAQQGPSIQPYKILVLGQKLPGGAQANEAPVRITSLEAAASAFGEGSMLHGMAKGLLAANRFTEAWFVSVAEPSGNAASGTIAFAGAPTEAGTVSAYIAGRRVQVAVALTDTANTVAAALQAAIAADASLPVSAAVVTNTVTITSKHTGLVGNDIDIRVNYFAGEELPAGLTAAVTSLSGGTGAPDLGSLISALGDEHYNIWANPFVDPATLATLNTELESRWGPERQIEGFAFSAHPGSHAAVSTVGSSLNSQFLSVQSCFGSPTPSYEWAATIAGIIAANGNIDPARPFQRLELPGILAPSLADRFTMQERNLLLYDGIATTYVGSGGSVFIERQITTYQENAGGADDTAYLDVNTVLTLAYLRYDFRNYFLLKYPRHKLADDGNNFGPGQKVMTPNTGKAECLVKFRQWESLALVENIDQFADELIVERNASDPNRLDFLLPPNLVNQFRVGGVQISPLL